VKHCATFSGASISGNTTPNHPTRTSPTSGSGPILAETNCDTPTKYSRYGTDSSISTTLSISMITITAVNKVIILALLHPPFSQLLLPLPAFHYHHLCIHSPSLAPSLSPIILLFLQQPQINRPTRPADSSVAVVFVSKAIIFLLYL
jgi:hypothetical protein